LYAGPSHDKVAPEVEEAVTTSAERAYAQIKMMILSGQKKGGARLPEDTLASEIGISRTPVRDALRRLQSEGLISITPNSGARVASWTQDELGEISNMRVMLEGYAAELAARKITPEEIATLRGYAREMEEALGSNGQIDLDLVSRRNVDFHRGIARAARNARLLASLEPLWSFSLIIRKFALFGRERMNRSTDHHREILDALEAGDGEWAGAIMRNHIRAARAIDGSLTDAAD
jgi:DNA-binding GntR family transcriptional regulator